MNPTGPCPEEETLAAFADGLLAGAEREAVERHLAGCDRCRADALAALVALESSGAAPPGLVERILRRRSGPMIRVRFLAAAAVALLAVSVWWIGVGQRDSGPGIVAQGEKPKAGLDSPKGPAPSPPNSSTPTAATQGARPADSPERSRVDSSQGDAGEGDSGGRISPAEENQPVSVADLPKPLDLGGPERFLAHLSTDKPLYRAGERLYARSVLLNAFTRKPATSGFWVWTRFKVLSPRGELVTQAQYRYEDAVAAFMWVIPPGQPGGEYTLLAESNRHPPAEIKFDIRSYRARRLNTDLQFVKKAYGPGEEVTATLEARRAEGGVPALARVAAVAVVDGREAYRGETTLNAEGRALVTFRLPEEIQVGDGTLALTIQDGGVQETAAKSIPIVVRRVLLTFYPEGGDLVAGVENRVYFEARTPKQDPADVVGRVRDDTGAEVARFESVHEGRGRFVFTPAAGRKYVAVLERPTGIRTEFPLGHVLESGVSLIAASDVFKGEEPVRVRVASPETRDVTVALFVRERELARKVVRIPRGRTVDLELAPNPGAPRGVLRVTVFDAQARPVAERLVFRAPERALKIQLTSKPDKTIPGGRVEVRVRTFDENDRPVSAVVGLAVVDDSVLEMIDRRERAPRLPVQALLGAEVRELRDAHVYLAGTPEAALRTDLLLGTQGWRRFAFVNPRAHPAEAALLRAFAYSADALRPKAGREWGLEPVPGVAKIPEPVPVAAPEPQPVPAPAPEPPPVPVLRGRIDLPVPVEEPLEGEFEGDMDRPFADDERFVRIYAHQVDPNRSRREDFTETVFWAAGLKTGEEGEAVVSFQVSDSITTFRVRADGFTKEGVLGEADATVESRRAFYAEPRFPLEVTAGDRIDLPIALVNRTSDRLALRLETSVGAGLKLLDDPTWNAELAPEASPRKIVPIGVEAAGEVELALAAQAGPHSDRVARKIRVVPAGFPIELNFGGVLERVDSHEIAIPEGIEPGSLTTHAAVYPSPLASLTQALAALLREPYGCFEQTSSANYPNVMALQYLKSHSGADPALIARASEMCSRGYQRLVSFECPQKGYEWFGKDPGHEALTAYGLMEFIDMAAVTDVDEEMVGRTRRWLLSRRNGQGGFLRNPAALDRFGSAPQEITDAYILWALTCAGEKDLVPELEAMRKTGVPSDDPYLIALAANVFLNVGDRETAAGLIDRLAAKQAKDGSVPGAKTSITRSGGESLEIETTSLAILAWLRSPKHTGNAERAMDWLMQRCKAGRFGATQSTILALKAIVAYDAAHARPKRAGKVSLLVDGVVRGEFAFSAEHEGPIVLPPFGAALTPGRHTVELRMEGGADLPYSLQIACHARTPASSEQCRVGLRTTLSRAEAQEGDPVDVRVEVSNRTKEGLPMVTAVVGLPGGLEPRAEQLKELVREGKVDAWETRGREVVLYWRSMAPEAKKDLTISCLAAVPGTYTGPASRAYLYYTDEHKDWAPGLSVKIAHR